MQDLFLAYISGLKMKFLTLQLGRTQVSLFGHFDSILQMKKNMPREFPQDISDQRENFIYFLDPDTP